MSDKDREIKELNKIIDGLVREVQELKNELDDLNSRLDDAHDEIRELEDASQSHNPIDLTRHHIITLRDAIEKFGGTNSERADLAEVLRCVEVM